MQQIVEQRIGFAFDEAVELNHETSLPMAMETVADHLWARGYDCDPLMLETMVKHKVVKPADLDFWSRADVEAAAEHLEDCGIFTPHAKMCQVLGCRYADFVRALRAAAERESAKYGREVPACDQFFVMHRMPPRGETNADGEYRIVQPSVFTFTLCDDVRERLERGEPV
ncbi:MAG: hypothetical protein FWD61_07635 [Phycisphaerales bacterium]|nr:hypothetical protein [Phycisphaerales bacterium]